MFQRWISLLVSQVSSVCRFFPFPYKDDDPNDKDIDDPNDKDIDDPNDKDIDDVTTVDGYADVLTTKVSSEKESEIWFVVDCECEGEVGCKICVRVMHLYSQDHNNQIVPADPQVCERFPLSCRLLLHWAFIQKGAQGIVAPLFPKFK